MKTQPMIHALPARYYTDPAIYAREETGLFAQSWQFALHAAVLRRPGDYATFSVASQNLFAVMGKDWQIRCFYNVCQHRGHELLNGTGRLSAIICPYHAWCYDLLGQLKAAPNSGSVPGFSCDSIRLTQVCTQIFCGFVFVNLDPNARPMDAWFLDSEAELRQFVPWIDRLQPIRTIEVVEQCNWKVSVENYSECYHCVRNHPTFAKGVIRPETYDIRPQGYCLRHTTECQNLDAMSYPIDLDAAEHAGDYSSWYLWPNFTFQVYPGCVLNSYHWQPLGVDRVKVTRGWYSIDGKDNPVLDRLAEQDRDTTLAEDIRLVESVQRGLNSHGYRPGPLVVDPGGGVQSEHSIVVLHQWIREAVGKAAA